VVYRPRLIIGEPREGHEGSNPSAWASVPELGEACLKVARILGRGR